MTDERVVVDSFSGLFDEQAEAVCHNINNRRLCFKHSFINASLRWEINNWPTKQSNESSVSINLESPDRYLNGKLWRREWGTGGGGIRYCKNCKHIDCIHMWDWDKIYVIEHGKYYEVSKLVSHCSICDRKISRIDSSACKPSGEAWILINAEIAKMGRNPITFDSGYGSGYMCEFPVMVSQVLDTQGEEAAIQYIHSQFGPDGCKSAMKAVHKMIREMSSTN